MNARRLAGWLGVAGPVGFVATWVAAGASTAGYSPVSDPISRLAAMGASHRRAMTVGFLWFGVAVPLYAVLARRELPGRSWIAAALSGVGTIGIALTPLDHSEGLNRAHVVAAGATYVSLVMTPLLAVRPLEAEGRHRAAQASAIVVAVSAVCLAATGIVRAEGLFQRLGLTVVDVWIVASAIGVLRGTRRGRATD